MVILIYSRTPLTRPPVWLFSASIERFSSLLALTAAKILLLSLIQLKRDCFAMPYFLTAAPHDVPCSTSLRILYFSTILLQLNFCMSPTRFFIIMRTSNFLCVLIFNQVLRLRLFLPCSCVDNYRF